MKGFELLYLKDKVKNKDLISLKDKDLDNEALLSLKLKSPKIGLVLGISFGALGVDRFYKGDYLLGFLKLFILIFTYTVPFVCLEILGREEFSAILFLIFLMIMIIWQISDWFLVYHGIKKDNFNKVKCLLKDNDWYICF